MSSNRLAKTQQGYALLLTMVALVLGTLTVLVQAASNMRLDRSEITRDALAEAKQALIGFAVTALQGPGHFVCPDDPADDDDPLKVGVLQSESGCLITVGRLPWRTLRMPDLRDSSGERLWYVVSENFIDKISNPVNSDTKGRLTVNGLAANEVIAIVFAPGPALDGQSRTTAADLKDLKNFLEEANADGNIEAFEAKVSTGSFNDQLVIIRARDVFPIVDNAVATRLNDEIVPLLRYYRDHWEASGADGFFPYARTSADDSAVQGPPGATECGTSGTAQGFVPPSTGCVAWTPPPSIFVDGAPVSCTSVAPSSGAVIATMQCEHNYVGKPEIKIETGMVTNAAASLVAFETSFIIDRPVGDPVGDTPISFEVATTALGSHLSRSYTLKPDDAGTSMLKAKISITLYRIPERIEALSGIQTAWFFDNGWYRQTWYAVSSARTAASRKACNSDDCLAATGIGGVENNKEVLLVLAGRALPAQPATRTGVDTEYFENQNVIDPNPLQFRSARTNTTFNDKLVVVAP